FTLSYSTLFFSCFRRPSSSTLFPYTTLFRSDRLRHVAARARANDGDHILRRVRHREREEAHARTLGGDSVDDRVAAAVREMDVEDRKSTRLNSSHRTISYAVFCLKKKKQTST